MNSVVLSPRPLNLSKCLRKPSISRSWGGEVGFLAQAVKGFWNLKFISRNSNQVGQVLPRERVTGGILLALFYRESPTFRRSTSKITPQDRLGQRPFPHLLSRCSRREQTPGEQTLPTSCYLSSGNYHTGLRHFPSGNIWPAHDQKHILVVTNMLAGVSQAQPPEPGLPSSIPPPHLTHPSTEPAELYGQADVSPDPQAPRHTARRKRKGSRRGC